MDALDLTSTEKRNRRKANTPQRHNNSESGGEDNGSPSGAEYPITSPTNDNQQHSSDDDTNSDGTIEHIRHESHSPVSSTPSLHPTPIQADLNRLMFSMSNSGMVVPNANSIYSHQMGAAVSNTLNWQILKEQMERRNGIAPQNNGSGQDEGKRQHDDLVMNHGIQMNGGSHNSNNNNSGVAAVAAQHLFINPASYGDNIRASDTPGIPERTKKQNRWAFNVWREWARKRNIKNQTFQGMFHSVPMDVGQATEEELDFWLCKFVVEIRRKDGNPYPAHTLMQIVMGIQRYLRQQAGKPQICILDRNNQTYTKFRRTLDARIKVLQGESGPANKNGRKNSPIRHNSNLNNNNNVATNGLAGSSNELASARSISPTINYLSGLHASQMWEQGVMGSDTAHRLLNAIFFHNVATLKIVSVDDHWNLQVEHFTCKQSSNQNGDQSFYIEFIPTRVLAVSTHGVQRIYEKPNDAHCVARLYRQYLSLLPASGKFYRHPVEPSVVDRSIRFSDQWIGKNRIRQMLRDIANGRVMKPFRGSPPLPLAHLQRASVATSAEQGMNTQRPMFSPSALLASFSPIAMYYMQQQELREKDARNSGSTSNSVESSSESKLSDIDENDENESSSLAVVESNTRKRSHDDDQHHQHNTKYVVLSRGADSQPPVAVPIDSVAGSADMGRMSTDSTVVNNSNDVTEGDDIREIDDECLEIKIPRNIRFVTLLKGNQRKIITLE